MLTIYKKITPFSAINGLDPVCSMGASVSDEPFPLEHKGIQDWCRLVYHTVEYNMAYYNVMDATNFHISFI